MASHGTAACLAAHRRCAAATDGDAAEPLRVGPCRRPRLPPATVDDLGPAPRASVVYDSAGGRPSPRRALVSIIGCRKLQISRHILHNKGYRALFEARSTASPSADVRVPPHRARIHLTGDEQPPAGASGGPRPVGGHAYNRTAQRHRARDQGQSLRARAGRTRRRRDRDRQHQGGRGWLHPRSLGVQGVHKAQIASAEGMARDQGA